jgi:hypothetical protein
LRTEGFFYDLDIPNGGLGIGKMQFLIKKKTSALIFFSFLVIKALDPYWIRIGIGLKHHTLDQDQEKMNTDPQPCQEAERSTAGILQTAQGGCKEAHRHPRR